MKAPPQYPIPLVIRYQTLIAFIKEEMKSAVNESARKLSREQKSIVEPQKLERNILDSIPLRDRYGALNNVLFKLRLWANQLNYETSEKATVGTDVLEALEASDAEVIISIHGIFTAIANRLHEQTSNWEGWYQSLDKSLLHELDLLVWPLRDEYREHLNKSHITLGRPSLVLCLDGGGVRSYSTLLILQSLMHRVQNVIGEKNLHEDPLSSTQRPARPRDFFDFIFGTSSGGMIAIMLGRLRMTVDECITSFKEFGNGTLARPRLLHTYTNLPLVLSKYGERTIDKNIQRVIDDFVPGEEKASGQQHTFAALDDKCKTGVWACVSKSSGSLLHLFRTYNHENPAKHRPHLQNPGLADSYLVRSVARATIAAPQLFNELVIDGKKFIDGGLFVNNPSLESYYEVESLSQERFQDINPQGESRVDSRQPPTPSVAILVSIGSGLRPPPKPLSKVGLPCIDKATRRIDDLMFAIWSLTERAHKEMEMITSHTGAAYHRFNVDQGVGSVRLDEWKKKGDTNETLTLIETMTKQYIEKPEVDQQLQLCAKRLVELRRKQL